MEMSILHLVRYASFGLLVVFSLIVLGISANFTHISDAAGFPLAFEGLCVAVSVLTLVTVVAVSTVDFFRRGAVTSFVIIELAWVFVLMVLWSAAAGRTSATPLFPAGCGFFNGSPIQTICHQYEALQAFAWLNFIILFGWLIGLSVSAAIAHNHGNTGVWQSSISDTQFFVKSYSGQPPVIATANSGYPPQQGYPTAPYGQQQPYQGTPPAQQSYHSTPPAQQQYYHQPVAEV